MAIHSAFATICSLVFAFSMETPAQQAEPWAGPGFQAPAAAMLEAARTVEMTKGSAATILMEDSEITIDAAGRATQRFRLVFRVDTIEAVQGWAMVTAAWQPWRQKRPDVRARVITADGVEHPLDPKTLSDSTVSQDGSQLYTDMRVYRGPLPAMAVGAVVEQEVLIQDTEPLFPGVATGRVLAGGAVPALRNRIMIAAPSAAGLKYELRLLPAAKVTKLEENGTTRILIEQGWLDPVDTSEPNLPPELTIWPQVQYTTAPSWKMIADSYRAMSDPHIRVDDVAQIARETIGPKDSRLDKVRKLTARLHKEVRYTGIEFGRANIVPQPPSEVFRRKYGDCKDKAATLVAMLRAAGVPAYLALLSAGTGSDILPTVPGGSFLNHVIVFAPGKPDIWIDAADEYSPVGSLPIHDQGRWALAIRETTTELARVPASTGMDNLVIENREYRLSEFGPATVIEESESHGFTDRFYRSHYGTSNDSKKLKTELEEYAKSVYVADGETTFETGDGLDLSKPFLFRIEARKARRGYTTMRDARAVVFPAAITSRLPDYFRTSDETIKKEDARREKPRTPRTADFVLPAPFVTEWRCRFVPPPGFKLRSMPQDKAQELGPAKLTQHWEAAADGTVTGTLRFDTVKARYTPAEAEALRKANLEFIKANGLSVAFDQEGYALLAAGKGKEAMQAFDALIKLHPTEALHHVQSASALLEVGLGETARKQAQEAVRLETKSVVAHSTLAWVLQHDAVGRRFKKGFDLEGALAEYRAALDLDPEDNDIRSNYAILLEFDAAGERYSAKANLAEAIAQYRKLKDKKYTWDYLDANLSAALFWAGRWKEVEEQVGPLPANDEYNAMLIAARTALEGAQAGIRRAAELTSDENSKAGALVAAGNKLLLSRRYQEAADLLQAANTGGASLETITAVRRTKPYEELPPPPDDAPGTVRKMLTYLLGPPAPDPKAVDLFSKEWEADGAEGPVDLDDLKALRLRIRYQAGSEFASDARGDVILSNIKLAGEGDDRLGYRVRLQMMELNGLPIFVTKAASGYRIVPIKDASLARVVLTKVEEGDLKGARQWLDWAREEKSVEGGEDPLAGSVFARVWKRGQNGDRTAIEVAAAGLLPGHKQVAPLLPVLVAARGAATAEGERASLDLLLFDAYLTLERWPEALATMQEVLRAYPDSATAFAGYALAALKLKNWDALESAARRRIERLPDDETAVLLLAEAACDRNDFAKALEILRAQVAKPKASMGVLNNYAWNGLFVSPLPGDVVEIAQRAARLTDNKNFGIVHTLASVYAEIGRVTEARKLILEMMDQIDLEEPNGPAWYVFGRIAEYYGQSDAALAAYRRTKEKEPPQRASTNSTWALAQLRARIMGAQLEPPAGSGVK
jgi:tetratricopeptide (TPR) repeat protein